MKDFDWNDFFKKLDSAVAIAIIEKEGFYPSKVTLLEFMEFVSTKRKDK